MTSAAGFAVLVLAACSAASPGRPAPRPDAAREQMVKEQIESRGIKDPLTLAALREVPRHEFVPDASAGEAYGDFPLPIGHGQTISQPYVVTFMRRRSGLGAASMYWRWARGPAIRPRYWRRSGAGSTPSRSSGPWPTARARLGRLGFRRVQVRHGDGYFGWPEAAPFDAIIVTAAAPRIPEPLKHQLAEGGRLVVPVGDEDQELIVVTRHGSAFDERRVLPVRFVPMTGAVRKE